MLENIYELLCPSSEIISGKFPHAKIKLFQTDVDEGWSNFMSYVASALFTLNVLSLSMQGGYVFASVSLSICLFVCSLAGLHDKFLIHFHATL